MRFVCSNCSMEVATTCQCCGGCGQKLESLTPEQVALLEERHPDLVACRELRVRRRVKTRPHDECVRCDASRDRRHRTLRAYRRELN